MKLDKKTMRSLEFLIIFTVVVVIAGINIKSLWYGAVALLGLFAPFLIGAALAFAINIMMSYLERHIFRNQYTKNNRYLQKICRPVSMVLAILIWFAIIVLVFSFGIPQLGQATGRLVSNIQMGMPVFADWLENTLLKASPETWEKIEPIFENSLDKLDWNAIINTVTGFLRSGVTSMMSDTMNTVWSIAGTLASSVAEAIIALVFACYLLAKKETYSRQTQKLLRAFLPEHVVAGVLKVSRLCYTTFSRFVTGQCLEACILGTIFFVILSVGRFSYAPLIAVVIGFTALIPIFGAFIGCIVGAFLILTEDPLKALIFVIIFLVVQQIEGNLIYPRVVGGSIGLPGIWTLVAVTVGGSLFGIIGMLVFIPLSSVFYKLLRQEVNRRIRINADRKMQKKEKEEKNYKATAEKEEHLKEQKGE